MKKAKELGKKNEGKEYKKPSMRLESNVGKVKGNEKVHDYVDRIRLKVNYKNSFLEMRNKQGVKWIEILNMYSKNDLINWYNENIVEKNLSIYKQYIKRKTKKSFLNNFQIF